jgi:hypothetical protein
MQLFRKLGKGISLVVIAAMLNLGGFGAAMGAMVGTDATVRADQVSRIQATLARDDVRQQLIALGVNPDDAATRVSRLSNTELASLDGQLQRLPAGGDALGVVLLVFLILLFTDIMGYTDIFPFVKHKN